MIARVTEDDDIRVLILAVPVEISVPARMSREWAAMRNLAGRTRQQAARHPRLFVQTRKLAEAGDLSGGRYRLRRRF